MLRIYILIVTLLFTIQPAAAASAQEAKQFVDSLGKQVLDVINSPNVSEADKQQQLQQMFIGNVDIAWMGRFVLGHGWQQANDAQRQHYMQVYQRYLLVHYTKDFSDYTGSHYTITSVRPEANGQFLVNMQIKSPTQQQQETLAGYRVKLGANGQFKIIDIIVEGVSLITTERADFSSDLQQKGMDAFVSDLENKVAAEKQSG